MRILKTRAEAMQEASEATSSGMMVVFLHPSAKLNFACHTARQYCIKRLGMEKAVCAVANYLYPECKVIAGNTEVSSVTAVCKCHHRPICHQGWVSIYI